MGSDERREARLRRRKRRIRRRKERNRQLESFGQINWDVYEHRQLWNMVKSARPPEMGSKAYTWADLAKKADAATEAVQKTAQRLLMSWRGESAVTAADAISELTRWGASASGTARTIGDRLDTYTHAVQEAKRRMPEPVHPVAEKWFDEGRDVTVLEGPAGAYMLEQLLDDHEPTKREQQRRKQEAVEVMRSYEDTSRSVHDTLPQFDDGPDGSHTAAVGTTTGTPCPVSRCPGCPPRRPQAPVPALGQARLPRRASVKVSPALAAGRPSARSPVRRRLPLSGQRRASACAAVRARASA